MKRTIESIKENEVVHCPSEELAVKFCQMLKKKGRTWSSGGSYDDTNWFNFKERTCYSTTECLYGSTDYYKSNNYTITPVTDFLDTKPDTFYVTSDSPLLMKAWWEEMKKMGYYAEKEHLSNRTWLCISNNASEPETKKEWLSMYISSTDYAGSTGTLHFTLPADFNRSLDYARQALEYWEPNIDGFIEWLKTQPDDKIAGRELYNEYKTESK